MTVESQQSGPAIPLPEDFPVDWETPEDASHLWRHDRIHFPDPVTPLEFAFYGSVLARGVEFSVRALDSPFVGWHIKRINTYFYQASIPFSGSPEETAEREESCRSKLRDYMDRLPELWQERVLPAVLGHLEAWDSFDLEGATIEGLVDHLDDTWERGLELGELHFEIAVPAYIALSEFDELHRGLLGSSGAFDSYRLLQGFDNTTVAASRALWELSREAAASDEVRGVLEAEPADGAVERLRESADGRAFLAKLDGYLLDWGRRCQSWGMREPSFIERPAPIVASLAELVKRADDDPPAIVTAEASATRERELAATREQLAGYPRPAVEEFEALLRAAQVATVIQDDHNFYIDFCCSYRARRLMLELGRRFAEAGVLAEVDDVFMLTPDEIRETASALPDLDRRGLAQERRAEMDRWGRVSPPIVMGSVPAQMSLDNPFVRFMIKFYGVPAAPSEQPDVLNGAPGSGGRARATARVIRSMDEAARLGSGEVLVAEMTAPPWTPLFARAAAVVTDTGGILSHSAVVAREYGIPAVVGTGFATAAIADGQTVDVDGDAGVVNLS